MKPQNRLVEFAKSSFGFWTCFILGKGGGGDDANTTSNIFKRAALLGIYRTLMSGAILYSHQTYFWTLQTRPWDFGFRRKLEIGWGEAFSGMITTLFRGHPEHYLQTLARTPRSGLWGCFRAPPSTAGIFVLMLLRCYASGI